MADTEQQVGFLEGTPVSHTECMTEHGDIITVAETNEVDNGGVGEDILQQALDEASGGYDNTDVEYTTEENIAVVADSNGHTVSDANSVSYSYVSAMPTESQAIPTVQTVQPGQSLIRIAPNTQMGAVSQVLTLPRTHSLVTNPQQPNQLAQVVQVIKPPNVQQVVHNQAQGTVQSNIIESISTPGIPQTQQTHVQLSQTDSGTPGSITVLTNSGISGAPLGSSANPIRIIQQGNKYTSVQQLTPEQVAQIMQVVQQQQLAQSTTQGGGSSVLFNPQTQTRIVYRVIYPSELHSKNTGPTASLITTAIGTTKTTQPKTITVPSKMVTIGHPRRPYRRRLKEDDEKVDGPELTREEKEQRKKHRPRTRSGRVSRPPKRMVQDYKHIHHLDWEEDLDDSDGGYSDYKVTDDEDGEKSSSKESAFIENMNSTKPKRFQCEKCEKAYIGAAGLARHYRLYPDHGNADDIMPLLPLGKRSTNGFDTITSLADDSSTQDSISSTASLPTTGSLTLTTSPISASSMAPALNKVLDGTGTEGSTTEKAAEKLPAQFTITSQAKSTGPRGALRAKQHYMQENTPTRRKARLKELVRQCTDEELMEIVLPRLSRVITTWEFLLMKVERGRPSRPHISDVLNEYEGLNKQVEKMCGEYLHPISDNEDVHERHSNILQMTNPVLAQSLGMNTGKYSIREIPRRDDSTFQYKLLTTEASSIGSHNTNISCGKRTVQLVTPDELVADSPAKKARHAEPCITSVSQSSGIVTVSMANGSTVNEIEAENHHAVPNDQEVAVFHQDSNENIVEQAHSMETLQPNCRDNIISQDATVEDTNQSVETSVLLPVGSEEMTGITISHVDSEADIKTENDSAETIISLATQHHSPTKTDILNTCNNELGHMNGVEGSDANEMDVSEASISEAICTSIASTEPVPDIVVSEGPPNAADQVTIDPLEQLVEEHHVSEEATAQTEIEMPEVKAEMPTQVLSIDQMNDINEGSVQVVAAESQSQEVLGQDGQTVIFSSDGQTFYQHSAEVEQSQEQQIMMDSGPQLVTMETPEGLVEGQLVTNEDGTQFLIPHQQTGEQAVYQTPDGLIVIQNPDGTLRILSQGDGQIPLETVQALLTGENDGQIQVENSIDQPT